MTWLFALLLILGIPMYRQVLRRQQRLRELRRIHTTGVWKDARGIIHSLPGCPAHSVPLSYTQGYIVKDPKDLCPDCALAPD